MRTLEHRGQKIICQYINDNFCHILMEKNIKYDIFINYCYVLRRRKFN